jgi:hypothetical protein
MALIKCPECEKEISDRADACPSCVDPFASIAEQLVSIAKQRERGRAYLLLVVILIALVGLAFCSRYR